MENIDGTLHKAKKPKLARWRILGYVLGAGIYALNSLSLNTLSFNEPIIRGRIVYNAVPTDENKEASNIEVLVDSENRIILTANPGFYEKPVWSPEGNKVAFTSYPNEDFNPGDIYIKDLSTNLETKVVDDPADDYSPSWLDEAKIIFSSDRNGNYSIYSMNLRTNEVIKISKNGLRNYYDPSVSPNGRKIAFTSDDGLYVMNADGSGEKIIFLEHSSSHSWSPNSGKVAFTDGQNIYIADADGNDIRSLTNIPEDGLQGIEYLTWSPDGHKIAFSKYSEESDSLDIFIQGINSKRPIRVTGTPKIDEIELDWYKPKLPVQQHYKISPEGKYPTSWGLIKTKDLK